MKRHIFGGICQVLFRKKWGDFNYEQRKSLEKSRLRIPRRYTSKKGDKGMKALTVEKAQEIRAGKGHYHWICRDWANFTSKAYSSYAAAGAAADAHVAKYPAHADKVSVFYCEKSSCQ